MLSYWDPLLDFITQSQLSQFTGLWNSPRSTMTHILLMNMRSFALTLWQSHYSLCSTAVKAKASPIARLPSPSRGAGCHQDACPSFGGGVSLLTSCSTSAWDTRGVNFALRVGRRQGKTGSNSRIGTTRASSEDHVAPRGVGGEGFCCCFPSGLSLLINTFSGPGAPLTPKASSLQSLLCIVFKYVLSMLSVPWSQRALSTGLNTFRNVNRDPGSWQPQAKSKRKGRLSLSVNKTKQADF